MGDTVSLDMEVTGKEELSSREDSGLVTIDTEMTDQDDETVFSGDMKFVIKRRD